MFKGPYLLHFKTFFALKKIMHVLIEGQAHLWVVPLRMSHLDQKPIKL